MRCQPEEHCRRNGVLILAALDLGRRAQRWLVGQVLDPIQNRVDQVPEDAGVLGGGLKGVDVLGRDSKHHAARHGVKHLAHASLLRGQGMDLGVHASGSRAGERARVAAPGN